MAFALRILRLCREQRKTGDEGRDIARQLLRSGTSVAANYRAAGRGRSKSEFIAKLGIVEEEADETQFWLELIIRAETVKPSRVKPLLDEATEVVAIVSASKRSAKRKKPDIAH